jgi:acyl carrier protein
MLDPQLIAAISEVFGVPPGEVAPESGSDTITEWDSIGHLKLILHIEETFRVRFPTAEIPKLVSAARIQEILTKLQEAW